MTHEAISQTSGAPGQYFHGTQHSPPSKHVCTTHGFAAVPPLPTGIKEAGLPGLEEQGLSFISSGVQTRYAAAARVFGLRDARRCCACVMHVTLRAPM